MRGVGGGGRNHCEGDFVFYSDDRWRKSFRKLVFLAKDFLICNRKKVDIAFRYMFVLPCYTLQFSRNI